MFPEKRTPHPLASLTAITHARTRKAALALFASLILFGTVGLSGCGFPSLTEDGQNDASASKASGDSVAPLPAPENHTAYPHTLHSAWGDTTLQQRPKRVVATGCVDLEILAALGVQAVLTPERCVEPQYVKDALAQIGDGVDVRTYEFDPSSPYPAETFQSAEPDLIIAYGGVADYYERLASICPVISFPQADMKYSDLAWTTMVKEISEALDLTDAGQRLIQETEQAFADYRVQHPELRGRTITYGDYYGGQDGLKIMNYSGSTVEGFFSDMGFDHNPASRHFVKDQFVSGELVDSISADVIMLVDSTGTGDSGSLSDLTSLPVFQSMPAVAAGRTVTIREDDDGFEIEGQHHPGDLAYALWYPGPLSSRWALDILGPILADAVPTGR